MTGFETRISYLFQQYLQSKCSAQEYTELVDILKVEPDSDVIRDLLTTELERANQRQIHPMQETVNWENMLATILASRPEPIVRKMFSWRRIAAAAAILVAIATIYVIARRETTKQSPEIATTKDVLAPDKSKATITLADGRVIYLDSISNGTISTENNVTIIKTPDGKIIYSGNATAVAFNTVTNPRGSRPVDLILSDGSKLWLDAATTITYPTAFIGKERKIEILTGQAYFEVAHDPRVPFIAKKGNTEVKVLGTHFNVSAFENEEMKVTLLEGSVKVSNNVDSKTIKPGEQARVTPNSPLGVGGVDVDQVMAWRNGLFSFRNADIKTVMQQLARWYDVEVQYQGAVPQQQFTGKIGRDLTLAQVLEGLAQTKLKFKIEGKKIIVLQ